MGIFVDIILVVLIALSIFLGYKKGLAQLAIKLCAFIIALLITLILCRPIAIINADSFIASDAMPFLYPRNIHSAINPTKIISTIIPIFLSLLYKSTISILSLYIIPAILSDITIFVIS